MMKQFLNFLSKPFYENFSLLIIIWALISFDVITCIDDFKYSICFLSKEFIDSYILVAIYTYIPKNIIKKAYLYFVISLVIIFSCIDLFTITVFNRRFNIDVAYIILGTNIKETCEFLLEYVTIKIISLIMVFVGLLFCGHRFIYRQIKIPRYLAYIFLFLFFFCIPLQISVTNPWNLSFFGKIYSLVHLSKVPDLRQYYTSPRLNVISKRPQNIVVIFGESFSKEHSSLYGYEKNTNPYLSSLLKDSSLLVFNKIKSPALHTVQSFKAMMSTYRFDYADSCEWYECTTLPEIAHKSSYVTTWISNQSEKGVFENIVGEYASLCDSIIFVGDKYAGFLKKDFDEEVINPIRNIEKDSLNLFFIHLMGSHPIFEERYPIHFNKFKETDYQNRPLNQRHNLATYDNSVLYNDSVVNQIFNIFKDDESIVFYFPDHSLDIFNSSDLYCGHANINDSISTEAGSNIPFMIYYSNKFKENFSSIIIQLRKNVDKSYCTQDLIYTIMDIIGVKFENNETVRTYSLVRI